MMYNDPISRASVYKSPDEYEEERRLKKHKATCAKNRKLRKKKRNK